MVAATTTNTTTTASMSDGVQPPSNVTTYAMDQYDMCGCEVCGKCVGSAVHLNFVSSAYLNPRTYHSSYRIVPYLGVAIGEGA